MPSASIRDILAAIEDGTAEMKIDRFLIEAYPIHLDLEAETCVMAEDN